MNYDRNQALRNFITSPNFAENAGIDPSQVGEIDFSVRSESSVVEALKTLLISHSNAESSSVTLRKINAKIQSLKD